MTSSQTTRRPTVLVTGASQGIGAGIAVEMARQGYDVAVTSTRPEKLAPVLEAIRAAGARALALPLQIREQASIDQVMTAVLSEFGELDVLVNNAALTIRKPALEFTPGEWDEVISTNLTGTFFMTQQMGRHLIGAKRPGCIISISSTHAVIGAAERSTYGVGKAGVVHMARMLAIEWAEYGIRVNTVAPGRLDTESPSRASTSSDPKYMQAMIDKIPLHRLCTVEDVAGAVSYLASDAASYITGQTLMLDGGLTSY